MTICSTHSTISIKEKVLNQVTRPKTLLAGAGEDPTTEGCSSVTCGQCIVRSGLPQDLYVECLLTCHFRRQYYVRCVLSTWASPRLMNSKQLLFLTWACIIFNIWITTGSGGSRGWGWHTYSLLSSSSSYWGFHLIWCGYATKKQFFLRLTSWLVTYLIIFLIKELIPYQFLRNCQCHYINF